MKNSRWHHFWGCRCYGMKKPGQRNEHQQVGCQLPTELRIEFTGSWRLSCQSIQFFGLIFFLAILLLPICLTNQFTQKLLLHACSSKTLRVWDYVYCIQNLGKEMHFSLLLQCAAPDRQESLSWSQSLLQWQSLENVLLRRSTCRSKAHICKHIKLCSLVCSTLYCLQ